MAMFGWDTPDMAEVYTRAEKKQLVGEGMIPISLGRSENTDCYTFGPSSVTPQEKEGKSVVGAPGLEPGTR